MKPRHERIEVLRLILANTEIGSQEALLKELEAEGYKVTQATLSRDLQKLKAAKLASVGGYRYILPDNPLYRRKISVEAPDFLRNTGFLGLEFSGNIVVMHTRPGYAAGITTEIDAQKLSSICGTLAGDDTILAIMREGATRQQVIDELATVLPAVKNIVL